MLDDAFQTSTDAALTDLVQRPRAPKPQAPAFSTWGLTRAVDRGARAGLAEGIASTAEVLGAFGQVMAATGATGQGMFATPTEAEREEAKRQREAIATQGVDFRSDAGRSFRNVAKDLMPDPVTAHGAEVAVAEFARLGGKAITAGVTLGPVTGAVVAGAEEGFTSAEKLAQEGVDVATRSQVGAVTGVLTALGFGIPVAGKTVAQTVGLAVAGGPATFITQQAATREILQGAGYDKLADQYDPFDPVGLTLSTLVPLGFGALAMRSAARARAGQAERAGADAPRETDLPAAERTQVAKAVDELQVDAARVSLLRENVAAQRLTPASDVRGMELHETALARAIDQLADGQRVDVSDLIPPNAAAGAMDNLVARLDANRAELLAEIGEVPPAALVRQLQSELDELRASRPADPELATQALARQIEADEGLTPAEALGRAREDIAARIDSVDARIDDLETALERTRVQQAQVEVIDQQLQTLRAAREAPQEAAAQASSPDAPAAQTPRAEPAADAMQARTSAEPGAQPAAAADTPTAQADAVPTESAAVARAAQELETLNPDLMVQLDGMDKPVRLADLMAQVRQEVAQDLSELPLIETAAACFLRT